MRRVGLRRQASTPDPCLFFIIRCTGSAAGAFITHIDDILGCGEPDVLPKIRGSSGQRFGELKLRESPFANVGMELAQESDHSAALTQDESAQNLKPLPSTPQLWAARQKTSS